MSLEKPTVYGYLQPWSGLPFDARDPLHAQTTTIPVALLAPPKEDDTCIISSGASTKARAGDTIIISGYGYTITEVFADTIYVNPSIVVDAAENTTGVIVPAAYTPASFKIAEAATPKIEVSCILATAHPYHSTVLACTNLTGTFEIGQILSVGDQEYLINSYAGSTVTVESPGLLFALPEGAKLTQSRKQTLAIKDLSGTIYEKNVVRLKGKNYTIIGVGSGTVTLASPGLLTAVAENDVGMVYYA